MARIDPVNREELSARQRQLYDNIMLTRPSGPLTGPFTVWIHTPEIAEHADRLANCFRFNSKLEKRLIELVILMICRDATATYAWSIHEPLGRKEGLTQETTEAIRERRRPDFKRDDEQLIYELVTELLATKKLSTDTFERAKAAFGLEGVIEAVTCAGCYGMIGLVLNAFEVPPRSGQPQLV
jgi:4-carboxymuconolactone decarboxylase